ncbi:MAG: hypothetical protein Q9182_003099 [Xanthomendoza sp. 2 TL-2023]
MKIATLQFSPKLGLVAENMARADHLLSTSPTPLANLDLLVLPELAFTGYNHPTLPSIRPHLEPTASGPSTHWARRTARRLNCLVTIGYPELSSPSPPPASKLTPTMLPLPQYSLSPSGEKINDYYYTCTAYNSSITVDAQGEVVAHYRKSHLYYTDEVWAQEGGEGFGVCELELPSPFPPSLVGSAEKERKVKTTMAICMDINPHHFRPTTTTNNEDEDDDTSSALCTHILTTHTRLLILCTAWLTHLPSAADPARPDTETLVYWFGALGPLVRGTGEVVCVFANRCGEEGGRVVPDLLGEGEEGEGEGVRYAGSSWVGKVGKGEVVVGGVMGRGEEGVLVVDTEGLDACGRRWRVFERGGEGEG